MVVTLLPDKFNFTIWKGATFRTQLVSYTDAGVTLRNLTGYSALCQIDNPATNASLLSLTNNNGGIILGGVAGTITLFIDAATTAALSWTVGTYNLTITAPAGGDTYPLLYGGFSVKSVP